jgi:hypothetical protein
MGMLGGMRSLLPFLAGACLAASAALAGDPLTCVQAGVVRTEAPSAPHATAKSAAVPADPPATVPAAEVLPLSLRSSAWELQAQGTLVTGTLEVRFEPTGEEEVEEVTALVGILPAPGLRLLGADATAGGKAVPLKLELAAPEPAGGAARRRARAEAATAG